MERIPFIRVENQNRRHSNISISSDSSEESIPVNAPLVRQQRCSADIDTMTPEFSEKFLVNGVEKHRNPYLDDTELNDSIQEIA